MKDEFSTTDEKILEATFKILQTEGFAKATTKKIASEAGVNEVTIFRNFENKKNLVETTKEYYLKKFIDRLEEIFDFDKDDEIEAYLNKCFLGLLNLPDNDFGIIRVAMNDSGDISEKKLIISKITNTIIDKLEEFLNIQMEKNVIRKVDARVLAIMIFSITFQSLVLWKIYSDDPNIDTAKFNESVLDILYNGLNPNG